MFITITRINDKQTDIKGIYEGQSPTLIKLLKRNGSIPFKFPLLLFSLEAYGHNRKINVKFSLRARRCQHTNRGIRIYNRTTGDYAYKVEKYKPYTKPVIIAEEVKKMEVKFKEIHYEGTVYILDREHDYVIWHHKTSDTWIVKCDYFDIIVTGKTKEQAINQFNKDFDRRYRYWTNTDQSPEKKEEEATYKQERKCILAAVREIG